MNSNPKLSYAIAAILSGSAMGAAHAAPAADTNDSEGIQEITVTAQRRTENMQDVPISIQALTAETLTQLNVTTFDDFVKFVPNVSTAGSGPGQDSIFMRGLSVGVTGQQGTGTTGPIPNVAVYLDEISGALPGRNMDVYAADIERIEVLEGPQGTLFGSGAQAGVLRYITNKPKLDKTEGTVNAGYSYTAHGDPNGNVDAALNLPLIADTLAVRGVVYSDSRGGYINNVPATFTRSQSDEGFYDYVKGTNKYVLPTDSVSINNANFVGNAINPVTYSGFRLSGLYKINDDWDALLTQSYQNMNAQGVFYQMPNGPEGTYFNAVGEPQGGRPLPALSVAVFNNNYDKDKFENTSLVIDGKVGDLKLVYAGGYLVRNIEQQQDYTNYSRGVYGYYYQCAGYSTTTATGKCYSPSATWQETEKNTHQSHELRVSTPDDWRIRGIGGVYYEQFKIYDVTDWTYKSVPTCSATYDVNCFNNTGDRPGETTNNPNVVNDNVGFVDDTQRTIKQKAVFGSFDIDLIPKTLIFTAGTRYYKFDESIVGGDYGSFYCKVFSPTTYYGTCTPATNQGAKSPYGTDFNTASYNHSSYHGFKSRANLSWHATDEILLYYTWSQGFRPGGFNRGSSDKQYDATGAYQYRTPTNYAPDQLTNNELGWKTEFLNHHLQINGAIYQEDWKNTIVEFFDPQQGFGNLTFVTNGPNYRVRGGELQVIARASGGLTVQGSGSYNKSSQTNSPFLLNNNPASPNYGQPITSIPNVYGLQGSPLGQSPLFQGNMRARYEFNVGPYKAFSQVGGQYYGPSNSAVGTVKNYRMPGYSTFDASAGFAQDAWNVQFFVQNLGNKNASTFTNSYQFIVTETVLRPRVAGVKFGYKF
ncbi:MAG: TonB-dependent receptor [Pseudomonadota bacterium]|nr:TonB-dependent receptor [Pseudomonadota bacterium]